MSRYRNYKGLDDPAQETGDVGFAGFNNRLRPDQLPAGTLAESTNGRLDLNGQWQVRKGIELIRAPLLEGGALILPFNLPTAAQIGDGKTAIINENAVERIYGSCAFSDPKAEASQYIFLAANTKVLAVNLADNSIVEIPYADGVAITRPVEIRQFFNKVFIFRSHGRTALEWDGNFADSSPEFIRVPSGDLTQPVQQEPSDVTIDNSTVTATFAKATNLKIGDRIIIEDPGSSTGLKAGEGYFISTVAADGLSATFYAQVPNEAGLTKLIMKKEVSVGLGFIHMPAPPFAIYHQRRLVAPYQYEVEAVPDSFTPRGVLDELIFSDILDPETYDQVYGLFRFNAGSADFTVGLWSFSEDILLVFNRNSIHTVRNSIVLREARADLLTDEVGCLARQSIQQIGNQVLFLSDNGIYGVTFIEDYKLRGTELPLSAAIDATIQRIDPEHAPGAVSVYFNNRYYIAVPLRTPEQIQTGTPQEINNAILIYNFLNKQWETIDTVADPAWDIENLIVAGLGNKTAVYAINRFGGVHRLEARADDRDRVVTQVEAEPLLLPIEGQFLSRQYTFKSLDRKRWREFEIHAESSISNGSNFNITAVFENPDDNAYPLQNASDYLGRAIPPGEDVSIRGRIGNMRAYGLQLKIINTQGRPKIRALQIEGSEAYRSVNSAE